jgi:pimeloyl-ACP methyl ester carboxylesterase
MFVGSTAPTRLRILAVSAAAAVFGLVLLVAVSMPTLQSATAQDPVSPPSVKPPVGAEENVIRPFRVNIPDAELTDLRRRIQATRWPDRETVADQSQGVRLAKLQELVRYWGTDYDWRNAEKKLNALPQFTTKIDGIDIHFIHVRSRHPDALPLLITHGWPGSILEQVKVIGPLTDPTAHGGKAEDAFDVIIPSMPGYGFSGKPAEAGWGPDRIARTWGVLMKRLGYKHWVAQGGDWGAQVANALGRQAPAGLLGIHTNMPSTVPADIARALNDGTPAPAGLSDKERAAFDRLRAFYKYDVGYAVMMHTRPQTVGYSVSDSPVGLAAWMLVHSGFTQWTAGDAAAEKALSKDEVLDEITLYWLTNTGASSGRLYWENNKAFFNAVDQKTADIALPVAITVFPDEIYRAPESWARRAYRNLIYFHEVDKGGHFAAWEQPHLFAEELRAAFRKGPASGRIDEKATPIFLDKIPPGYRDWKLISVAHEEGNLNSLGAVLGNDVAIMAYRDGTLPYPDGAIIAALHWRHASSEENNNVFGRVQSNVPGAPTNVQFMVKDSKKYGATGGWGFGHFNEREGKPGDEAFMSTCFACHQKMKARDLVFTKYSP